MEYLIRHKKTLILVLIIIPLFSGFLRLCPLKAFASTEDRGGSLIQVGDKFPMTVLVSPKEKDYRDYLGLTDKAGFYLKEINADVMIVEFLNKYCYHCQRQAYLMNRVYKAIKKDPEMRGKVKILGIGVGNNQIQLEHFRQEKRIPFPLIPDKNFVAFEKIGYPEGTPFTIIVKRKNGEFVVKDTHLGMIENRQAYEDKLRLILSGAALAASKRVYKSAYQSLTPGATGEEINAMIIGRLQNMGIKVTDINKLNVKLIQQVFMIKLNKDSKHDVWFAAVGSEGKVCDVCHDIHFIYLFDRQGRIRDFIPIHITKFGNKPFDDKDIEKIRKSLVGRNLTQPIQYNPETDAVTSASMTSSLIFKGVKRGGELFDELKKEGYTQ